MLEKAVISAQRQEFVKKRQTSRISSVSFVLKPSRYGHVSTIRQVTAPPI